MAMANVHTLSDLYTNDAPFPRQPTTGLLRSSSSRENGQPEIRRPSCLELFFPSFKLKTFIFIISMVQIGVYIAQVVVGSQGLTPTHYSFDRLGASYGPPIQRGEIWRLITPIFLHASIWHILFNVFFQLRMGFILEAQYGAVLLAAAYFSTGLAGNLFSVAVAPCKIAVGASTAGFGLIGMQFSEIALAWHRIQAKDQIIFNIAFFVLMAILVSVAPASVVDWRGHFGGLVAGFGLGIIYNRAAEGLPSWYKTGLMASYITLTALYVASFVIIFAIPMAKRCQ